jgi:hypothetical protein
LLIINKYHWRQNNARDHEIEDLLEDSATDADIGGEGALLVDVAALNSGLGSLEAYARN